MCVCEEERSFCVGGEKGGKSLFLKVSHCGGRGGISPFEKCIWCSPVRSGPDLERSGRVIRCDGQPSPCLVWPICMYGGNGRVVRAKVYIQRTILSFPPLPLHPGGERDPFSHRVPLQRHRIHIGDLRARVRHRLHRRYLEDAVEKKKGLVLETPFLVAQTLILVLSRSSWEASPGR